MTEETKGLGEKGGALRWRPLLEESGGFGERADLWGGGPRRLHPAYLGNIEHPYKELPPFGEMKAARVLLVTPLTGLAAELPPAGHDEHPPRPGMYIIVPQSFPDECEVSPSLFGYFAQHLADGALHKFRVWPAEYLGAAEEQYESVRAESKLMPAAIGARVPQLGSARDTGWRYALGTERLSIRRTPLHLLRLLAAARPDDVPDLDGSEDFDLVHLPPAEYLTDSPPCALYAGLLPEPAAVAPVPIAAAPAYRHDCERCTYMGGALVSRPGRGSEQSRADLYYCEAGGQPRVVARYGDGHVLDEGAVESHVLRRGEFPPTTISPALSLAHWLAADYGKSALSILRNTCTDDESDLSRPYFGDADGAEFLGGALVEGRRVDLYFHETGRDYKYVVTARSGPGDRECEQAALDGFDEGAASEALRVAHRRATALLRLAAELAPSTDLVYDHTYLRGGFVRVARFRLAAPQFHRPDGGAGDVLLTYARFTKGELEVRIDAREGVRLDASAEREGVRWITTQGERGAGARD